MPKYSKTVRQTVAAAKYNTRAQRKRLPFKLKFAWKADVNKMSTERNGMKWNNVKLWFIHMVMKSQMISSPIQSTKLPIIFQKIAYIERKKNGFSALASALIAPNEWY